MEETYIEYEFSDKASPHSDRVHTRRWRKEEMTLPMSYCKQIRNIQVLFNSHTPEKYPAIAQSLLAQCSNLKHRIGTQLLYPAIFDYTTRHLDIPLTDR
jgi:hypothetical protein